MIPRQGVETTRRLPEDRFGNLSTGDSPTGGRNLNGLPFCLNGILSTGDSPTGGRNGSPKTVLVILSSAQVIPRQGVETCFGFYRYLQNSSAQVIPRQGVETTAARPPHPVGMLSTGDSPTGGRNKRDIFVNMIRIAQHR